MASCDSYDVQIHGHHHLKVVERILENDGIQHKTRTLNSEHSCLKRSTSDD